jgi:hypothetical protein
MNLTDTINLFRELFKKSKSENTEDIGVLTAKEFSQRKLGEIYLKKIEGMTFGLIELQNREYTQIFIARENEEGKILTSVHEKYATDLLVIANKYGWNFLEKDPTTIIFEKDIKDEILLYGASRKDVFNYRQDIDNKAKNTQISNVS